MATITPEGREEVVASTLEALREQALRRLRKRRDFNAHVVVYLLVSIVVWGIWTLIGVMSGSWWPWPVFLTFVCGIWLAMNAWDVFLRKPITEDELQREITRLAGSH